MTVPGIPVAATEQEERSARADDFVKRGDETFFFS